MIRVKAANEPDTFDALVRQPGLQAIAELVGDPCAKVRRGPKRAPVATERDKIPPSAFPPLWCEAADDLLTAYHRICAYACVYIPPLTGTGTVDHFAPKSLHWDHVYEWTNYRLACPTMNARKRDFTDVMDPFEVNDGMFALDLIALKAVPGPHAGARSGEVQDTIARLGLDGPDYQAALEFYHTPYRKRDIKLTHLERCAPFLASEMRRQGDLNPEDA